MKKIFQLFVIILILSIIINGCKKSSVVEDNTVIDANEQSDGREKEVIVSGIATKGDCYISDDLVCIDVSQAENDVVFHIKNLKDTTLYSASLAAGSCSSDKIDVESGKIVTFVLHNCEAGSYGGKFTVVYNDKEGNAVNALGAIKE